jgi:hypothetical protein
MDDPDHLRFTAARMPPIEAPEVLQHETTGSQSWQTRWGDILLDAISEHDPWGLLAMRPNGDLHLFSADPFGAWRAATYPAGRVHLLFPEWRL